MDDAALRIQSLPRSDGSLLRGSDEADRGVPGTRPRGGMGTRQFIRKKSPKCTLELGTLATLVFLSETPVTRFARDRNALIG